MAITLCKLKPGDCFTIYKFNYPTAIDIWVLGKYDSTLNKYQLFKYDEPYRHIYAPCSYLVYPVSISINVNYV